MRLLLPSMIHSTIAHSALLAAMPVSAHCKCKMRSIHFAIYPHNACVVGAVLHLSAPPMIPRTFATTHSPAMAHDVTSAGRTSLIPLSIFRLVTLGWGTMITALGDTTTIHITYTGDSVIAGATRSKLWPATSIFCRRSTAPGMVETTYSLASSRTRPR